MVAVDEIDINNIREGRTSRRCGGFAAIAVRGLVVLPEVGLNFDNPPGKKLLSLAPH